MTTDFSVFGFITGILVLSFSALFYSIWKDIRQIDKSHPWEKNLND